MQADFIHENPLTPRLRRWLAATAPLRALIGCVERQSNLRRLLRILWERSSSKADTWRVRWLPPHSCPEMMLKEVFSLSVKTWTENNEGGIFVPGRHRCPRWWRGWTAASRVIYRSRHKVRITNSEPLTLKLSLFFFKDTMFLSIFFIL